MKKLRSHPLYLLETASRFWFLLFLPLLRAAQNSFSDFPSRRSDAWFDYAVLLIIILFSICRWRSCVFSLDQNGIYFRKGILLRKERYLAYHDLTSVSVTRPWYYVPFHAVHLKADTDGGNQHLPDFSVTIHEKAAEQFLSAVRSDNISPKKAKRSYTPGNFYIVIFSVITSSSLTGVIFAVTALSKAGDIFGEEIKELIIGEFTKLANVLAFGLPPATAILGYTILFCWLFSFFINLSRHLKFVSTRKDTLLEVHSGLFSKRHSLINIDRIHSLIIRQSILSKAFGFFSVFIRYTGYGKNKKETGVLIPSGKRKDLSAGLTMLIPEIPFAPRQIQPKRRNLSRFVLIPTLLILSGLGVGGLGFYVLPNLHDILLFLLIVTEAPLCWWLTVRIYAFFRSGIGVNDQVFTLYYTHGYQILTCSIPREKVVKIELSQSPFQIRGNCCNVTFHTYGEKRQRQTVANLNWEEVFRFLQEMERELGENDLIGS